MSLEEITTSRRSFLQGALAGGALTLIDPNELLAQDNKQLAKADEIPVLKKSRISYDQLAAQLKKDPKGDAAGNYEALKFKYLDQVLVDEFKMVLDPKNPKRNPQGFMKQWLYLGDAKQRAKAIENIREDLRAEGKIPQKDWDDYTKRAVDGLADCKIGSMYRGPPGQKIMHGYLLADKTFFQFESEQDAFSFMDCIYECANASERGIRVGEKEINFKQPLISTFNVPIINLYSKCAQYGKILQGARKVSNDFKSAVQSDYLNAYNSFMKGAMNQIKNSDTPNEKEAAPILESFLSDINARMQKLGYEHKLVDAEKNTWDLVKIR